LAPEWPKPGLEEAVSQIFASISVRLKMILAFAAVLTCTIGLGLFAIERLEAVNANAQEIKANYLPATRVLGRIAQIAERFRQNRASMLLATTDEQRVQVVSTMKEQTQTYAREREAYQPLILSGEERRWSDAFDAAWKRYLEIDDSIVGLVAQGKHGEAVELFRGGATKAMAVYRDALQGGIELNVRQGTQAADMGAKLGASANRWILAVLGLATMLCIGVGWTIVNGVSSPIGAMTTAMCRLAEGDLAVEITCGGRGDEIGAMAKAVEVFKQNAAEHRHLEAEQKQQEVRATREKQAALIGMAEKIEAETGAAVESVGSQTAVIAAAAEEMSASSTRTGEAAHRHWPTPRRCRARPRSLPHRSARSAAR
jgi:methyl-accepting chemotaxis protein